MPPKVKSQFIKLQKFNLIELLFVMAIFTLLLSFLQPSLKSIQNKSLELMCKGNMRQIGTALHLYVYDNSEWLPMAYPTVGLPFFAVNEYGPYLNPIIAATHAELSDKQKWNSYHNFQANPSQLKTPVEVVCPSIDDHRLGYAWNWRFLGYRPGVTPRKKLFEVKNSLSKVACIGDNTDNSRDNSFKLNFLGSAGYVDYISSRHDYGSNMLILDNHVEWHDFNYLNSTLGDQMVYNPK